MGRKKVIDDREALLSTFVDVREGNELVNAKGKSSALNQKLFTIGIMMAKRENGRVCSEIEGQFLRALFKNESGSFYDQIKRACNPKTKGNILGWYLWFEDKRTHKFSARYVITGADFSNGHLKLYYNDDISDQIIDLKDNFTTFPITTIMELESAYALQLYKIFKSAMDYERATKKTNGPYYVTYSLDEFRDLLGLNEVKDDRGTVIQKKMFTRYVDLKRYVIDVVVKELEEKTEIRVSYQETRSGIGGRVTGITFILRRAEDIPTKVQKTIDGELVTDDENVRRQLVTAQALDLLSATGYSFLLSDMKSICSAAQYDIERISKACEVLKQAKGVENPTGWLIAAINQAYEPSPVKSAGGRKRKESAPEGKSSASHKRKAQTANEREGIRSAYTPEDLKEMEKRLLRN